MKLGFQRPWRRFRHPDGRSWEVRTEGVQLLLKFVDPDGEAVERARKCDDGDAAARELEALVRDQLADGFTEVSEPAWRTFLDELVAHWTHDDPSFDAKALRSQVLAAPDAEEIVGHVMGLAAHWVARKDGSAVLDMDHALDRADRDWLCRRGKACLPAVLLALRHHDWDAQIAADGVLCDLRDPDSLEALLSVLEHPAPNCGDRPQHSPSGPLCRLGPPSPQTAARLVRALGHADFRVADAAAAVCAEHSADDSLFEALLAHADRAQEEDGYAWSLMRAAEVRRDPRLLAHLRWMQQSSRFCSAGYPERIREAIAGLKR